VNRENDIFIGDFVCKYIGLGVFDFYTKNFHSKSSTENFISYSFFTKNEVEEECLKTQNEIDELRKHQSKNRKESDSYLVDP
jgi:response regulator of citrate/malate metabolism